MSRGLVMALVLVLGGCAGPVSRGPPTQEDESSGVERMLVYIERLAAAERPGLVEMGARFPERTGDQDSLEQRLRYGFWRATPGHPGVDLDAARQALEGVLIDAGDRLEEPLRILVRLQLRHVRRLDALREANADLTRENRQLRKKIRDLTDLERRMGSPEP